MNNKLESVRSSSKFHVLDFKGTQSIRGGQTTKGGRTALYSEDLYNQNGAYIGYRTHYRSWGSDENTGNEICYNDVEYYSTDTIV